MINKKLASLGLALLLAAFAFGQEEKKPDDRFRPEDPREEEDLTPEQALLMLKEAGKLMALAEELLNDTAKGKALATEEELVKKLKELLKDEEKIDPANLQKQILEKIQKLMKKTERSQDETVKKLGEVIRRAKSQGQGQGKPQQPQPGDKQQQAQRPQQPGSPAQQPYDPNRTGDPVNKFRSQGDRTGRWGDLPARLREAILTGKRDLDEYPAEFRELLKEYMRKLAEDRD